jgi:2,3-bisphosphoglycerate-independent phosphoglycerate mutase
MTSERKAKFVILAILDGWGIAPAGPGNAISQAKTVNINKYWASFPHTQLSASGESVGLPRGEAGNTEVGHLNIGAGRIVYQDLTRINLSIADGTFFKNQALLGAIEHAKQNNSKLHYMGLIGAGGVHSNIEHLFALIQMAAKSNFNNLYIHLFTDGRDSPPTAAKSYIAQLREVIKREGVGQIATVMGRYWAMDRDLRWQRTKKAYFALTKGKGNYVKTPEEAIESSYDEGKTDEFVEPSIVTDSNAQPIGLIQDNDAVVFFNFRIDRPRQLTKAFVAQNFEKSSLEWDFDPYAVKYEKKHEPEKQKTSEDLFERVDRLNNLYFATMTEYAKPLSKEGARVAFSPELVNVPLGRVISENDLRQLRASESEKERFVTFYFNGQQDIVYPGEERLIIPSPKVATYDLKPEMSARELTNSVLEKLRNGSLYDLVVLNFANPDMVGHTGNIGPAVIACEAVDEMIGKLANYVLAYEGALIIIADHGNVEEMIDLHTGSIDTEHSTNPVPFITVSNRFRGRPDMLQYGILADVAPTVLGLLGIIKPDEMTGRDLLSSIEKTT